MLVTFRSPAYSDITMFGEVGLALLQRMGHSGSVPGALAAEDVPKALERLRNSIVLDGEEPVPASSDRAAGDEDRVSLAHRALPLIKLLEAAAAAQAYVIWER